MFDFKEFSSFRVVHMVPILCVVGFCFLNPWPALDPFCLNKYWYVFGVVHSRKTVMAYEWPPRIKWKTFSQKLNLVLDVAIVQTEPNIEYCDQTSFFRVWEKRERLIVDPKWITNNFDFYHVFKLNKKLQQNCKIAIILAYCSSIIYAVSFLVS